MIHKTKSAMQKYKLCIATLWE